MKIETIRLKNFKAFKEIEMRDIPSFCIIVGANGTGKSTLFDVFGFLKDAFTDNVQIALSKRGGYKEVHSRDSDGPIVIEIKFRFEMTSGDAKKKPLATYSLAINEKDGQAIVEREELRYRRGSHGNFLSFQGELVVLLLMSLMMSQMKNSCSGNNKRLPNRIFLP